MILMNLLLVGVRTRGQHPWFCRIPSRIHDYVANGVFSFQHNTCDRVIHQSIRWGKNVEAEEW